MNPGEDEVTPPDHYEVGRQRLQWQQGGGEGWRMSLPPQLQSALKIFQFSLHSRMIGQCGPPDSLILMGKLQH